MTEHFGEEPFNKWGWWAAVDDASQVVDERDILKARAEIVERLHELEKLLGLAEGSHEEDSDDDERRKRTTATMMIQTTTQTTTRTTTRTIRIRMRRKMRAKRTKLST